MAGISRDLFGTTKQRLKQFGENFGIFREKTRASKKSFGSTLFCRRATLTQDGFGKTLGRAEGDFLLSGQGFPNRV